MQIICPYPNCGHTCDVLTNVHARTHGFSNKKELFKKHGDPITAPSIPPKVIKWAREQTVNLSTYNFNSLEVHADRLKANRKIHES
jgi:hypothetical protein